MREHKQKERLLPTWEEFRSMPSFMRYTTYVIASIIVILAFVVIGYLMPFNPWQFKEYKFEPKVVCEDEAVTIRYRVEVVSGPYMLGKLTGDAFWVSEDGRPSVSYPVDVPLKPTDGVVELPSPVKRETPSIPGRWNVGLKVQANGRMFGIVPVHTSDIEIVSKDSVLVIDNNDPMCD